MLGTGYAWIGLRRTGSGLVLTYRTAAPDQAEVDTADPIPMPDGRASVRLRVEAGPGGVCRFAADAGGSGLRPVGAPFTAFPGKWIGATLGLFGTAPAGVGTGGVAEIDWFRVGPS